MNTSILKLIGRFSAGLVLAILLAACSQPSDSGPEDRGQIPSDNIEVPDLGTIGNPYTPGGGDTCQPGDTSLVCKQQFCAADPAQNICAELCANGTTGGAFSCDNVCTNSAVTHSYCDPVETCQPGDTSTECQILSCEETPQQDQCADFCAAGVTGLTFCGQVCEGDTVTHAYCDVICTIDNAAGEPSCMAQCNSTNPPGYCAQLCEGPNANSLDFCSGGEVCTVNNAGFNTDCLTQCESSNPPGFCGELCAGNSAADFDFCTGGEVCTVENASGNAECKALCNVASPPNYCADSYCKDVAADVMPGFCGNICQGEWGYQFCQTICDADSNFLFCAEIVSCEQDFDQPKCVASCAKTTEGDKPVYCISLCDDSDNGYSFCDDDNQQVLGVTLEAPSTFKFIWRRAISDLSQRYIIKGTTDTGLAWQTPLLDASARYYNADQALYEDLWTKLATYYLYGCPTNSDCTNNNSYLLDSTRWAGITDNKLEGIGYLKSQIDNGTPYAEEEFGRHIALSRDGRVMAVSTRGDLDGFNDNVGGVQMFYRDGSGTWVYGGLVQPRELRDNRVNDNNPDFGHSVSLSADGEYMAVGAPKTDYLKANPQARTRDVGAVYVYQRQPNMSEWTLLYRFDTGPYLLDASLFTPVANSYFGASVSLSDDGNLLAIGAPGGINKDQSQYKSGFVRLVDLSTEVPSGFKIFSAPTTNDPNSGNSLLTNYGQSVSLSGEGNVIAVGAGSGYKSSGGTQVYPVYIYPVEPSPAYLAADTLGYHPYGSNSTPDFGPSGPAVTVSKDGSVVVVSPLLSSSSTSSHVYIARASEEHECCRHYASSPSETLSASNEGIADNFGSSVVMSDDSRRIAISARLEDGSGYGVPKDGPANDLPEGQDSGAIYVFDQANDGTWVQTSYIKASNPGVGDEFGTGMAMSGDGGTLVVGAPYEDRASNILMESGTQSRTNDNNELENSGAVYLY